MPHIPVRTRPVRAAVAALAALAALTVSMVLVPAGAGAQSSGSTGDTASSGTTSGSSNPQDDANNLLIECSWLAADVDDDAGNGVQYDNRSDPGWGDDGPKHPGQPCDIDAKGLPPLMDDGVGPMIQVLPNAEDLPTGKLVELWAAIDYPLGLENVSNVVWHVFHPDDSLAVQVHGERATSLEPATRTEVCEGPLGMFMNAWRTGQLSDAAINDPNVGLRILCREYVKDLWRGEFELSKHQPCGIYRVEATAVGASFTAHVDELSFTFEVLCFFNLELDFDTVAFGNLVGGGTHVAAGNVRWGDGIPSVKNTGNSGMGVKIAFSAMCNTGPVVCTGDGKHIDAFGAAFGIPSKGNLDYRLDIAGTAAPGTYDSAETVTFGTGREHTLCPNDVGKLDLIAYPPVGLVPGQFEGSIFIWGYSNPICPTDDGSPYSPDQ